MARIVLRNISKHFGASRAVDNLDLEIRDRSFTTLLGPSGCGKTTTLRMIAGLETPSGAGEIHIGDRCVYSAGKGILVPPGKRRLGLVFQSYALWPHLTVEANIAFGPETMRMSASETRSSVERIARSLQISELLGRYPSELSGGQQQRVAIARVLVMQPEVLLLDEPLSNLDAKLRMDMRAELKRLHAETGSTIVYVTHDQMEALTMSTCIAVMDKGMLQQLDEPMRVYDHPANLFTADFVGNPRINLLEGAVTESGGERRVEAGPFVIPLDARRAAACRVGDRVTVGVRAEDLVVLPPGDHGEPQAFRVPAMPSTLRPPPAAALPGEGMASTVAGGQVYSILPAGAEWYIRIRLGEALVTATLYRDPGLGIDEPVGLAIARGGVKLFDAAGRSIPEDSQP